MPQPPQPRFRLISGEKDNTEATLESSEAEIAFGVFPNGLRQTKQTQLFQEHLVGIARTGHPAIPDGRLATADPLNSWLRESWPSQIIELSAHRSIIWRVKESHQDESKQLAVESSPLT